MIDRNLLRLYFIMGSINTNHNPAHVLQQAIDGGVKVFQYREKGLNAKTGDEKLKLGISLWDVCQKNKVPFIVNDDLELAVELQANGVHIGQQDESLLVVRDRLPANMTIGVSVSTIEEALLAEKQGADYLGVGPIFATSTKTDALKPIGIKRLQKIAANTSLPLVAIGGIKKENAREIMSAGAAGISVISAISEAKDVGEAVRELEAATRSGLGR